MNPEHEAFARLIGWKPLAPPARILCTALPIYAHEDWSRWFRPKNAWKSQYEYFCEKCLVVSLNDL